MKRTASLFILLLVTSVLASCSSSEGSVKLCDYKHIAIPESVKVISEKDITASVRIDLITKEVLIPKGNSAIIELGDIVTISISVNGLPSQDETVLVGVGERGKEFDDQLVGKRLSDNLNFTISDDCYKVTIKEISIYADSLTDSIARKYYKRETAEQVLEDMKDELIQLRVADYMYQYLVNNSMIRGYYLEGDAYVKAVMSKLIKDALEEDFDAECGDFWSSEYGVNEQEFRIGLEKSYDEYLILCEFMRQEQVTVTDSELCDYFGIDLLDFATDGDKVFGIFGKEYALYQVYNEISHEILLSYANL